MTKTEFLTALRKKLSGLPQKDIDASLGYYEEMIDDRMEDGTAEEEAVAAMGSLDDVTREILLDAPFTTLVKVKAASRRKLRVWEIVLLALGSPIWLSLLIAAAAIVFSVYVVIWSVNIALWATDVACGASAVGLLIPFVVKLAAGEVATGFLYLACTCILAGLAIVLWFFCKQATALMVKASLFILRALKGLFIKKGANSSEERESAS